MASWQSVLNSHPSAPDSDRPEFWDTFLAEHPDVLHRLLADIYQATYGAERPPTLDDLWNLLATQRFSMAPFGDAVMELLGSRSVRWLAQQTGVALATLQFYISGRRNIVSVHDTTGSMRRIEAVAEALRVHPSYFMEWRRLWIMTLIDSALANRPELSVGIFRRFSGFENGR